jgi:hypothetical protein
VFIFFISKLCAEAMALLLGRIRFTEEAALFFLEDPAEEVNNI